VTAPARASRPGRQGGLPALAAAAALVCGCGGGGSSRSPKPPVESERVGDDAGETGSEDAGSEQGPLLPDNPHAERAGGEAVAAGEAGPPPRFVPPADPRPEPGALARGGRLAVVAVRFDVVEREPGVLYALDAHLGADPDLRGVVGLADLAGESVDLGDLAVAAREQGRDLLLVDVAPGRRGTLRDGYLVDAASGRLVARLEVDRGEAAPASLGSGLLGRIAAAYYALGEPE